MVNHAVSPTRRSSVTPNKEEEVRVWDCRHKDLMVLRRRGGDLAIEFYDASGKYLFSEWYQLRKPYGKNYEKIIVLFGNLKDLLMRQEDE